MTIELRQRIACIALLMLAWTGLIYLKQVFPNAVTDLNAIIAQVQVLLGGVVGYHVGDAAGAKLTAPLVIPPAPPVPSAQGGFIAWSYFWFLMPLAFAGALVSGCTTTTASAYSGLYTQAKAGVQVFDDNSLKTMHDLLCAQPYSAVQRHPEIQPGFAAMCGPLANAAAVDPVQVQRLLDVARQLGLTPAGAPRPQ